MAGDKIKVEESEKQLERLSSSVDDASRHVYKISVTFLLVLLYLTIAVGATTHRDLLIGTSYTLPILNVKLSLKAFYWLAPLMMLLLHFYLLLQIYVLSRKIFQMHAKIENMFSLSKEDKEMYGVSVFPFLLSHALPGQHISSTFRVIIWFMIWIVIALLPLTSLLFAQLRFLPSHDEIITIWHRSLVIIDLGLLWFFWPNCLAKFCGWSAWLKEIKFRNPHIILLSLFSFSCIVLIFIMKDANLDLEGQTLVQENPDLELIAAEMTTGKTFDEAWFKHVKGLDLRGRNLQHANLSGVKMPKVKLSGAQLQEANLNFADLREATFVPPEPQLSKYKLAMWQTHSGVAKQEDKKYYELLRTQLQNATLHSARFEGADLRGANLDSVDLSYTLLTGSDLRHANLQNASLAHADLSGAYLQYSNLQNANLFYAILEGADVSNARVLKTRIWRASLKGSTFFRSEIDVNSLVFLDKWSFGLHSDIKYTDFSLSFDVNTVVFEPYDLDKKKPISVKTLLSKAGAIISEDDFRENSLKLEEFLARISCENPWICRGLILQVLETHESKRASLIARAIINIANSNENCSFLNQVLDELPMPIRQELTKKSKIKTQLIPSQGQ